MKFIVDQNVGKLVKWLRMMGYDTVFFSGEDDWQMVMTALAEGRIILTRDTGIMSRGVVANGRLKAILIASDDPDAQIRQVVEALNLDTRSAQFTRCLEDNEPLEARTKSDIEGRVPPYVFATQDRYFECPVCHRIYWKGTHWADMNGRIGDLEQD